MSKKDQAPSEIRLKKGKGIPLSSFWHTYKNTFNISPDNEFKILNSTTDKLGQTHHRFKQYYRGIEIADMQYILHEKNGIVQLANGKLIHGVNINTIPALTEMQALQKALVELGAEIYMWENPVNEAYKRRFEGDKYATYYPKGELMISSAGNNTEAKNFHLVYRFEIYSEKPSFAYTVDVDASTGKILNKIPLYMDADVAGIGLSLYNGEVNIMVSGPDFPRAPKPVPHWQLDDWNAYGGSGLSWRPFNPAYGTNGGYDNAWYDVLDTDPVELSGTNIQLSFYHRYYVEPPGGAPQPYNAWDGMNIRISTDDGETWNILDNPSPVYDNSSLYSFGEQHGEGANIPGWTGLLNDWTKVTHDLSAYSDQTVKIRFAFASDPGYSTADGGGDLFGWQVDDILIKGNETTLYSNSGDTNTVTRSFLTGDEVTEVAGNYRLRESDRAGGIFTYNALNGESYPLSIDFVDDDSSFTDANENAGVNAHWSMENTLDYYMAIHGRDSYDNESGRVVSYIHYWENVSNAQYTGNGVLRFGDGDGVYYGPLVSVDVVGHEFTHGVTEKSAGLIYQAEYGALNESFSDIFGESVEHWVFGKADWLVGHECAKLGVPFRSMSNPYSLGDPDTYKGPGWANTNDLNSDNGGVHTNSGVQNHWFYLLVEGGTGINDNGLIFNVEGISWSEAEQIAYRNLTVYLTPTSEYAEARAGSINAATDLFGSSSQQVQSVKDAWNAVGVAPSWGFSATNTHLDGNYFKVGEGNVGIAVNILNPNDIGIELNAIIENISKTISDTIRMYDDGAHSDSSAGDNYYGTFWNIPEEEDFYSLSIQLFSPDSNYAFLIRDIDRFTSVGPVVLESYSQTNTDTLIYPGDAKEFNLKIKNLSSTDTIFTVTSKCRALNNYASVIAYAGPEYGNILPGVSANSTRTTTIVFSENCPLGITIPFVLDVYSEGYFFWSDTFYIAISPVLSAIQDQHIQPYKYELKQNYPNPFNPETVINYSVGAIHESSIHVSLKVYDLLGKEVQTLVDKNESAGEYSVIFDASNLPSGVYFYRIESGRFKETRKMILIR